MLLNIRNFMTTQPVFHPILQTVLQAYSAGKSFDTMKGICSNIYLTSSVGVTPEDAIDFQKCVQKDYFCGMCCNGYIGKTHILQRETCGSKCKELIKNPSGFYVFVPFSNEANANSKIEPKAIAADMKEQSGQTRFIAQNKLPVAPI